MFEFLQMMGNHENRLVEHDDIGDVKIDTCSVNDGKLPYETAVCHPEYNDGEWVIVEAYPDAEMAKEGHRRWTAKMTSSDLPDSIKDCKNASITSLIAEEMVYPRQPKS